MSLPQTTYRLVKEFAGPSYEYKEVPLSPPRGDELLVKVGKVALCGTDIQLYQWNHGTCLRAPCTIGPAPTVCAGMAAFCSAVAEAIAEIPFTPGHEMVGEVRWYHTWTL